MSKVHANRGIARNKKPLQNIIYRIEDRQVGDTIQYILYWAYEKDHNRNNTWFWHGAIAPEQIKNLLSPNQWSKFRQGERQFVIQRRIDGHNIPVAK
jgi:hypothetical protein